MRKTRSVFFIAVVGVLLLVYLTGAAAQSSAPARQRVSMVSAVYGGEMFMNFCASCHGEDGKGNGPAAKSLKTKPTDLTTLAKFNNGEYPEMQVMAVLNGYSGGHGSTDMPVWGSVFRASMEGELKVWQRIYNLTKYVESIQEPSQRVVRADASNPPKRSVSDISPASGPSMYRSFCGSCHGIDGKGDGPAAAALKVSPGDLTLLARANNGKFPEDRIVTMLGSMPGTEAHGSKEMPVWGDVFRSRGEAQMIVTLRIANLVRHLESLQR